jgi:hypothetical protein
VVPLVVASVEVLILVIDCVLGELMEGDGSRLFIFKGSLLVLSYFLRSQAKFHRGAPKRFMLDCFVLTNDFKAC